MANNLLFLDPFNTTPKSNPSEDQFITNYRCNEYKSRPYGLYEFMQNLDNINYIRTNIKYLKYVTNITLILNILKIDGLLLEFVHEQLRANPYVVLCAVVNNKKAFEFAAKKCNLSTMERFIFYKFKSIFRDSSPIFIKGYINHIKKQEHNLKIKYYFLFATKNSNLSKLNMHGYYFAIIFKRLIISYFFQYSYDKSIHDYIIGLENLNINIDNIKKYRKIEQIKFN